MISRVYLYNISNYEEIENRVGNDYPKPILQEVGPFTYKEKHFKDEVVFNENGTVTYKTRKQWIFLEDESPSLDSMIVNFNIISMVSSIHFFPESRIRQNLQGEAISSGQRSQLRI